MKTLEVINETTFDRAKKTTSTTIDYYEAARLAYTNKEYMKKYLDSEIKDIREINKGYRPIWKFTYKIVSGEEKKRVKVVNKDPDNLLVSWVPGGKTVTEILDNMKVKPLRS
jgi:hypothetical protein